MRDWMSHLAGARSGRREVRPLSRPALEYLEDRCLPAGGFVQANLVADLPGQAAHTDPGLIDPWGLAARPGQPFTVADAAAGQATQYNGAGQAQPARAPLAISIPLSVAAPLGNKGTPSGVVYNNTSGFVISANGRSGPAQVLFATVDGTISGWNPQVDPSHALLVVDGNAPGSYVGAVPEYSASYTGLALNGSRLYAADFRTGTIEVFDQNFRPVQTSGGFVDSGLPVGFVPFNIQTINGNLYVTYASQDHNPAGGFLDVFNGDGVLLQRLDSLGPLNAPYGLALAPPQFGPYGGELLVGNFGDGRINVFDPNNGTFLGTLQDSGGNPISNERLWSLTFGTGGAGGDPNTLYFTAGVGLEQHGLFGALSPTPSPAPPSPGPASPAPPGPPAPPLSANGQNFGVEPGTAFNGPVATFTSSDHQAAPSSFTASIDWGDGSGLVPAQVGATRDGTFQVSGSHTYTTPGKYNVTVTVTDGAGNMVSANPVGAVGTPNERFVAQLYQDLLDRPVDALGLAYWNGLLSAGVPRSQVAAMLETTDEYHSQEINQLYLQLLNRPVDPVGLAYFLPLLANGGTVQLAEGQLLGSDEYFTHHGGTNDSFLQALYHDTVNRPVDALGQQTFGGLLAAGVPRSSVALSLLGSAELASDEVRALFGRLLRQPATAAQVNSALSLVEVGAVDELVTELAGSNEYFARV
jgi:uncharacterized protein (TIGR03118 family)